jgi:hypothetical protein
VKSFRLVVFFEAAFSGARFAASSGESDSESETVRVLFATLPGEGLLLNLDIPVQVGGSLVYATVGGGV